MKTQSHFDDVVYLEPFQEAVGLLVDVKETVLIFEYFVLPIMLSEFDCSDFVQSLIGEVVTILRTDISDREYIIIKHHSHGHAERAAISTKWRLRNARGRCEVCGRPTLCHLIIENPSFYSSLRQTEWRRKKG